MLVAEIDGRMPCLISRQQMRRWGALIDTTTGNVSMQALHVRGQTHETMNGHLMLDLLEFGPQPEEPSAEDRQEVWTIKR